MIINSLNKNKDKKNRWERIRVAKVLDDKKSWEGSLASLAKRTGIPRTTIQHWNMRTNSSLERAARNVQCSVIQFADQEKYSPQNSLLLSARNSLSTFKGNIDATIYLGAKIMSINL